MAAKRLRFLPRNATDVTRVLACVDGSVQNLQVSPDVGSVQLERTTPIREFFSWPGKRNYEGLYWSSTNRRHVDFESLLEREYLLAADNASDIVAIAAQPLGGSAATVMISTSRPASISTRSDGPMQRTCSKPAGMRCSFSTKWVMSTRRPQRSIAVSAATTAPGRCEMRSTPPSPQRFSRGRTAAPDETRCRLPMAPRRAHGG